MTWLGDNVFSIREAACTNLKDLTNLFGIEWASEHIVPKIVALCSHSNYLYRMTALFCVQAMADSVDIDVLRDHFVPLVVGTSHGNTAYAIRHTPYAIRHTPYATHTTHASRHTEHTLSFHYVVVVHTTHALYSVSASVSASASILSTFDSDSAYVSLISICANLCPSVPHCLQV